MKISPEVYKHMAAQHARLKTMKQGQFVQWACHFWQNAYDEGFTEAEQKYAEHGINVSDGVDVEVWDEEDLLTLDDVWDAMLSVKGIGLRRAKEVIKLLLKKDKGGDDECDAVGDKAQAGKQKAV